MFKIHIQGGSAVYKSQDPIRVTNHKDPISEETKKILSNTKVWRMEYDFYNFAKKIFDQELHLILFPALDFDQAVTSRNLVGNSFLETFSMQ